MIDSEGGISEVVQVDVTDEKSVQQAMEKTVELWGRIDILVNIGAWQFLLTQSMRRANLTFMMQSALEAPWETPPQSTWMLGTAI